MNLVKHATAIVQLTILDTSDVEDASIRKYNHLEQIVPAVEPESQEVIPFTPATISADGKWFLLLGQQLVEFYHDSLKFDEQIQIPRAPNEQEVDYENSNHQNRQKVHHQSE